MLAGFIILATLLLLLLFPLEVHTHYRRKAQDDLLLIKIIIIKNFWEHRIEIPIVKLKNDEIPSVTLKAELESPGNDNTLLSKMGEIHFSWENIRHVLENIQSYYKLFSCYFKSAKFFFRPWVLKSFHWYTSFGTGDAALTGITGGILWSTKALFWQQLGTIVQIKSKPDFNVQPDFYNRKLEMEIDGIFGCYLGNIIIAAIFTWLKLRSCERGINRYE